MAHQNLKIKKTNRTIGIELLTFLLLLSSALIILIYDHQLPAKLPIYFNGPSKDKNGLATKDLLWACPILFGIIAIGLNKLTAHVSICNDRTQKQTNTYADHSKTAIQMLRALKLLIGMLCLSLTLASVLNGLGNTTDFEPYFYPFFPIVFTLFPVLYVGIVLLKNKHKPF